MISVSSASTMWTFRPKKPWVRISASRTYSGRDTRWCSWPWAPIGNTRLGISGEDAQGVLPGVDFLRRVNLGEDVEVGEKVAVIGGGDVAIDAARMAARLGAKEVNIVYRRTQEEMPANAEEIEEAEDEKIRILYLLAPTRIITENGRVKGMECIEWNSGITTKAGDAAPSR